MTVTTTGIANQPASRVILDKLRDVCENVLEPVRDHFGKAIVVHSGHRSPAPDTAVKGAASSQHCKGEAVDFHVPGSSVPGGPLAPRSMACVGGRAMRQQPVD